MSFAALPVLGPFGCDMRWSMATRQQEFTLEIVDHVAWITLSRPERLNALTFTMYRALTDTIEGLASRTEVRAVILTGAGRGFCSGGDRRDIIADLQTRDEAGLLEFTRQTGRLIHAVRTLGKPVIACVNGVAVGAGAVIAVACDLRVATQDACFGFVFPQVGLSGADMGAAYLLPRLVGLGNASELLLLGEVIGAERALRIGLINHLALDVASAIETAKRWAHSLAGGSQFAHAATKKMLQAEANMSLVDALEAEAQIQAQCMTQSAFRNCKTERR